ncbi:MAG TPA: hypothetical protein VN612_02935 [Acidobacteriaceae bacterium]|jgi:hypothetical protein|nr:hypothetical protein [Acidobacteriaceae bacterium]
MVAASPKPDIDTELRVYTDHGIRYAYHDYAQMVVIVHPDGYQTARAMSEMEIREGEHLRRLRTMHPDEADEPSFTVDLARNMRRPRFWWDCLVMLVLFLAVIATGAILQAGHPAHLSNK